MARMAIKPATITGVMVASAAPQTTTSASPRRIKSYPSPIASVPQAHAKAGATDGPSAPSWMPRWAAAAFGMILVTANGLTLPGPHVIYRLLGVVHARHPAQAAPEYEPDPLCVVFELPPGVRISKGELGGG